MKKILAIFLTIFLFLLLVPPMLVRGQSTNPYSVSGYVFDDLNANGVQDGGERGISGAHVYADTTYSQGAYTDQTGYFVLNNLPAGTHSIEIANAGSGGSRPTTSERFSVSSPRGDIRFGIQQGGYDVQGYVRDQFGNPLRGAKVYLDFPSRQTAYTNNFGYYRIENVGYDSSTPIYGQQGGHNVYVEGYDSNPVLVNPQYATQSMQANFNVRDFDRTYPPPVYPTPGYPTYPSGQCNSGQIGTPTQTCVGQQYCTVTRYQRSDCTQYDQTTNCQYIPGYCNYQQPSQPPYQPPFGQCTPNTQAGQSYQGCSGNGQLCTLTPTYGTNCQVSNVATNCQPYTPGVCGYQGGYQPPFGQPSYGQSVSDPYRYLNAENIQPLPEPDNTMPIDQSVYNWDTSWDNWGNMGNWGDTGDWVNWGDQGYYDDSSFDYGYYGY